MIFVLRTGVSFGKKKLRSDVLLASKQPGEEQQPLQHSRRYGCGAA